ncbi:MAG: hypothetical protein WCV81_02740 [Microgenomates group bacterium]|jgi:hypothetical protein
MKEKGFIPVNVFLIFTLLLVTITGTYSFIKKSSSTDSSNTLYRFITLQGGEYDVYYPAKYSAAQDYFTKAVAFKLASCNQDCDTLIIADPVKPDSNQEEMIKIGIHEFYKSKEGSDLLFNPKSLEKLGLIKIKSSNLDSQPSVDFKQIISSLKFIKEVPTPIINPTTIYKPATATPQPSKIIGTVPTFDTSTPSKPPTNTPSPTVPPFLKIRDMQTGPSNWANYDRKLSGFPEAQLVGISCYWNPNLPTDSKSKELMDKLSKDFYVSEFCRTEIGKTLITGTKDGSNYIALVDTNSNVISVVNWKYPTNSSGLWECVYPVAYRAQDNIFSSINIVYVGCSHTGGVYIVDLNAKTASQL